MVSDLNKNIGGLTDLLKKRRESAYLHPLIHPSSPCTLDTLPWYLSIAVVNIVKNGII